VGGNVRFPPIAEIRRRADAARMSIWITATVASGLVTTLAGMWAKGKVNRAVFGDGLKWITPDDRASEKYEELVRQGEAPRWPLLVSRVCMPLGFAILFLGTIVVGHFTNGWMSPSGR
jgi:hypothetical protein